MNAKKEMATKQKKTAHRVPGNQVECSALAPKPPRAPDAVQVGLKGGGAQVALHWNVKVDDQRHL